MKGNFGNCLKLTLAHEGEYSNHPKDPGGATMRGVTQRTYDAYRKSKGLGVRPVKHINPAELQSIYRDGYWNVIKGNYLPLGIDCTMFDASVNSGPARGPKWTQRALGVVPDGRVGPITLETAAELTPAQTVAVIKKAAAYRLGFLKGLRTWSTFGRGWSRRVSDIEASSIAMVADTKTLREEAKASTRSAQAQVGASVGGALGFDNLPLDNLPDIAAYGVVAVSVVCMLIMAKRVFSAYDRSTAFRRMAEALGD